MNARSIEGACCAGFTAKAADPIDAVDPIDVGRQPPSPAGAPFIARGFTPGGGSRVR